jgi:hypothetical protein
MVEFSQKIISKNSSAEYLHNTYPRESHIISGTIAKDGVNAKASKMIENAINDFSYRVYQSLNNF